MFSPKNAPDSTCSSKLPALTARESASEKLSFQERNPILLETQNHNFSIRDYIFSSRSEGLEVNWPFTQHVLHLGLKHGVKHLLPPFEPPCSVRVQCGRKAVGLVKPVVGSAVEQIPAHTDPRGEAASIRQASLLGKPDRDSISRHEVAHSAAKIGRIRNPERVQRAFDENDGFSHLLDTDKVASESPLEIGVVEPREKEDSSYGHVEKNCRLVFQSGAIFDRGRAEDIISNSSSVADLMASKVCPVCKTFSSASNTTLNAHIDQCLSMESNAKGDSSQVLKSKVKPTKKRLMVDIYATAPRCTLEDLDKRNGTNWAVELAFASPPTVEVNAASKKPKLPTMDFRDINEDAVHVDSNGIKLRVLSKINSTPQMKEELKLQKHAKSAEACKKVMICKKHLIAKFKKKPSLFVLLKSQMKTTHESDNCSAEANGENEESSSHVSDRGNLTKICSSASLGQWRFRKDVRCASDITVPTTRSRLAKTGQVDPGNSSVALSKHLKFSRPSEDLTSPQKIVSSMADGFKRLEKLPVSSSKGPPDESRAKKGLLLRISKASGNFVASSRSKKKEIELGSQHQSDTASRITSEIYGPSTKDQIHSSWQKNDPLRKLSFNSEARKVDVGKNSSSFKKFRKHRSLSRNGKSGAEFREATNGGVHGRGFYTAARTSEAPISCSFDHLMSVTKSPTGEMFDYTSTIVKDVPRSEERDDGNTTEKQKHSTWKRLRLGTDFYHPFVENFDLQAVALDSRNDASKISKGIAAINPFSNDTMNSENLQANFAAISESSPLVEHVKSISESEGDEEQAAKRSENQEACYGDMSREEIEGQNIQRADKMEVRGVDSYADQPTECAIDTLSTQSGCLTSHEDVGPEILQKSLSITSVRTVNAAMILAGDSEPCGSPNSTASTLSPSSSRGNNYTDSEAEPVASSFKSQDTLVSRVPISENTSATEARNVKGRNQEIEENFPAQGPDQSVDDKPFRCACRHSLSSESQSLRSNATHKTTKGKRDSNLLSRPRVSSSFTSYQNQRSNNVVTSILQPAAQSTATKSSSDFAAEFPICSGLVSPTPSSQSHNSNPILRLMGKNLMVVKEEEYVRPRSTVLDYPPRVNLMSPLGLASTNNLLKQESFGQHHQILGGSPAFVPAASSIMGEHQFPICEPSTPMSGFSVTSWVTPAFVPGPDQQAQQRCACNWTNSSTAPYMVKEVTAIDDSPDTDKVPGLLCPTGTLPFATAGFNPLPQRPQVSFFSSENHIRDIPNNTRVSLLPNTYAGVSSNTMKRRSNNSGGHGPLLPRPFVFQPPTNASIHRSVCYL